MNSASDSTVSRVRQLSRTLRAGGGRWASAVLRLGVRREDLVLPRDAIALRL